MRPSPLRALFRGRSLSANAALVCTLLFALVHILFFHNKFFDINRSKYYLLVYAMPPAALIVAGLRLAERPWREPRRAPRPASVGMAALLLGAVLSVCFAPDRLAALTGREGRYGGGLFFGALALSYALGLRACAMPAPDSAAPSPRPVKEAPGSALPLRAPALLVGALLLSGALCALIGVLNFLGYDPLVFYVKSLQPIYHNDFISTIGNINFFSAYMCLIAALSGGLFLRARGWPAPLALLCFVLSWMGVLASRSESGMIGMGFLGMAALALPPSSPRDTSRLLVLPGAACLGTFLLRTLLLQRRGYYMELYDSIARTLLRAPKVMLLLGVVLLALAALLRALPPRPALLKWLRRGQRLLLLLAVLTVLAVIGLMVYYTALAPEAEPPLSFLRVDAHWGTYRGFIWPKTFSLWRELPLGRKLIGVGPDCLRPLLVEKCYDEMVSLTGIIFDNAHSEFLQLLITVGALGLAGYLLLAGAALRRAWRAARGGDAVACALFAALCAHLAQSFFNIAQPETTPAVFLLLALAAALPGPSVPAEAR